jgi:hypothetical protein
MADTRVLVGGPEVVGAVRVLLGTFFVGGFSSDPLPWRILATFLGVEDLDRMR